MHGAWQGNHPSPPIGTARLAQRAQRSSEQPGRHAPGGGAGAAWVWTLQLGRLALRMQRSRAQSSQEHRPAQQALHGSEPRLLLQFLLILFVLGVYVGTDTGSGRNWGIILASTLGLVVNAAWVAAAYWAVRQVAPALQGSAFRVWG